MESRGLRIALRVWVTLVLLFFFVPVALIVLYAFNKSNIESWPIRGSRRKRLSTPPLPSPNSKGRAASN